MKFTVNLILFLVLCFAALAQPGTINWPTACPSNGCAAPYTDPNGVQVTVTRSYGTGSGPATNLVLLQGTTAGALTVAQSSSATPATQGLGIQLDYGTNYADARTGNLFTITFNRAMEGVTFPLYDITSPTLTCDNPGSTSAVYNDMVEVTGTDINGNTINATLTELAHGAYNSVLAPNTYVPGDPAYILSDQRSISGNQAYVTGGYANVDGTANNQVKYNAIMATSADITISFSVPVTAIRILYKNYAVAGNNFLAYYNNGASTACPKTIAGNFNINGNLNPQTILVGNISYDGIVVALTGRVTNDNDGQTNGVDGATLAGVTVNLYQPGAAAPIATTTTDASGNYRFDVAANTNYVVEVVPSAGFESVSSTDTSPQDSRTSVTVGTTDVNNVDFGVNQPPVAGDDGVTGQTPGTAATVPNILSNDTDPNSGTLVPANISLVTPTGAIGVTAAADGDVTGFTVPGEGAWALNPATGGVTFTPQAGFTGDPTPIDYTVRDAAGLTSPPATISIDYNRPPVATNDSSTGNMPGDPVTQNILANDTLSTGAVATAANTTVELNTTGLPAGSTVSADGHTVTVPGEGTWVYDPAAGDLTFTPLATFTGNPTPVPYTLTETATGLTDTATAAVTYNTPPVATNDSSTGNTPGDAVTQNILANDTLSTGAVATAANTTVALNTTGLPTGSTASADGHTVTVPGEGTWVYDPATGDLTFTPLATFTGTPTPVPYTLTETATGLSDTATAAVTYNKPPVATNDSSTGNTPGDAVTQNILANDTLSTGAVATAANTTVALNTTGLPAGSTVSTDGHTVTVPGEGTWVYDPATGKLTFTPLATFTGNPTPVPYTLTETATGLSDTATAAVAYSKPPVATNDSSTGNTPGDAVTQNILANDTLSTGAVATAANTTVALNTTGLPTGSTVSVDGHTVTVPGEGTWVYDPATGDLTFTPLATFTGNPTPVPYTLTETATDLSDTATAAVTYNTPPVATNDSSTGNTLGDAVTQNILANDTLSTGAVATAANTTVALNTTGLPAGSTVSADGHTVTVPGEGTWVYDPATGDLTFTPLATFTGNPTPVPYTLTETATGLSDTATAAVSYDQGIVFDYGDLPYTGAAVNYPKVKAQFKDANGNHVPDDAAAIWLGQIIDAEADGFTNPANPADYAKGDDISGAADEDGLKVDGGMTPGTKKWVITANSNQPATVHYGMWIDWGTPTAGPDGTFDAFYSGSIATASPANDTVNVTIPATFLKGSLVNIRLIASTAPLDQAAGFSTNVTNGEIEDYQMTYEQALPVRLVSFQGSASESDAVLTWKAADQVDFDRYEIERSADGKQFSLVGTQLSNNLKAGDYRFTDKGAASAAATLYYRLKMVDTDGSYAYSSIRAVSFQDALALTAAAWPTLLAAGETVNVSLAGHKGSYQVTMFSEGGRQILERKGQIAAGTIQLPTQGLPFGTYLIKVSSGGWQKTLKIAIVK